MTVIVVLEQRRLTSLRGHCCLSCLSCHLLVLLLLNGPHMCCSSQDIIFQFSFHLTCSLHCALLSLDLQSGERKHFSVADRHYSGSLIHRCLVTFFYTPLNTVRQLTLLLHLARFIHTVTGFFCLVWSAASSLLILSLLQLLILLYRNNSENTSSYKSWTVEQSGTHPSSPAQTCNLCHA